LIIWIDPFDGFFGSAIKEPQSTKEDLMRIVLITTICLCCALYVTPIGAKTWHVPGDATTIKGGIGLAYSGDTVLVACGTYYEHDISMKSGVCLRSETGEAICVTIDAQQHDWVIYCRFLANTTRIEGFTITGGLPEHSIANPGNGAGLYCLDNSSPSIKNCVITGNSSPDYGGGVCCHTNSSPTFVNCTIAGNSASSGGGGLDCQDNSSPTLTDCSLSDNSSISAGTGGGMRCFNRCSPTFTNCTFSGNQATFGAGICVSSKCTVTLTGCTFSDNYANGRGGGMLTSFGGSATLTDCTFSNNTAHLSSGGGVCSGSDGSVTLNNCSLIGNSAKYGGAMKIQCNGGCASVSLISCSLIGNSAQNGGGIYMENASYLAADTTEFKNNTASNEGPRGYIGSGSEAVLTCCVHGLSGFAGDGTITLNNEGCWTPTEGTSWGRIKALYR
jgi:parallel beta-helix repeat protein/predicted outer membrane repeat protein